jgi:MSHA biogenesis protein MshO
MNSMQSSVCRFASHFTRSGRGVTLVEMVVVIAITGIIAAAVAVFIRRPVEAYVDSTRRAELTDIADTALRRITRDLRTALPNSIRVQESPPASGIFYLEYLPTISGGRYRAYPDSIGGGNILDFTVSDSAFDVIGVLPTAAPGDQIVVYNTGAGTTDAYSGGNRTAVTGVAAPAINITAKQFPFPSPGSRFFVVGSSPVTYVCNPVEGTVRRVSGYTIQPGQPNNINASPLSGAAQNSRLAMNVSGCNFTYTTGGATGRTSLVALTLQITQSGETVKLFQQAHVNNVL